jgi:hypothetical protein
MALSSTSISMASTICLWSWLIKPLVMIVTMLCRGHLHITDLQARHGLFGAICLEFSVGAKQMYRSFSWLKIDTRIDRRPDVIKPNDYFARTNLMKLLARARILEDQLTSSSELSCAQFRLQHKISQRYLRSLISFNNLSPKIKKPSSKATSPNTSASRISLM